MPLLKPRLTLRQSAPVRVTAAERYCALITWNARDLIGASRFEVLRD